MGISWALAPPWRPEGNWGGAPGHSAGFQDVGRGHGCPEGVYLATEVPAASLPTASSRAEEEKDRRLWCQGFFPPDRRIAPTASPSLDLSLSRPNARKFPVSREPRQVGQFGEARRGRHQRAAAQPPGKPELTRLLDLARVSTNYELFNGSNFKVGHLCWNYRGCWHQTGPQVDAHCIPWVLIHSNNPDQITGY